MHRHAVKVAQSNWITVCLYPGWRLDSCQLLFGAHTHFSAYMVLLQSHFSSGLCVLCLMPGFLCGCKLTYRGHRKFVWILAPKPANITSKIILSRLDNGTCFFKALLLSLVKGWLGFLLWNALYHIAWFKCHARQEQIKKLPYLFKGIRLP